MDLRAGKKRHGDVSLQDPVGRDKEGNEITIMDILSQDEDSVPEQVGKKLQLTTLFDKMKDVLEDREKRIIEMRYGLVTGEEKTQREIAKMMGISRSYVSRIEKKALHLLYEAMEKGS